MKDWDWQTDTLTHRSSLARPDGDYINGDFSAVGGYHGPVFYLMKTATYCYDWRDWDITKVLYRLSDEELKVCMLHQPVLAELCAKLLRRSWIIKAWDRWL